MNYNTKKNKMNFPENLRYTKEHIWVKIEGDTATIGITEFAQSELGDIVYVDIEQMDEIVDADEVFGTIEAVKTVSDLFMPIKGEVFEFNEAVEDEPELVNTNSYDTGWIIKAKVNTDVSLEALLTATQYKSLVNA